MRECVRFEHEKKYIRDFIGLYGKLYNADEYMQNDGEIYKLLTQTHPLSKYFTLAKFCIYNEKKIAARFAITEYPDDKTAYFGFFECEDNAETAQFLFAKANEYAKSRGLERLLGPVDASFWIKYRLKTNLFDLSPYTGEPYNKPYYEAFFKSNGFETAMHYTSSVYSAVGSEFHNEKYEKRLETFTERGYEIKSPKPCEWNECVADIYAMISALYSDFPVFKPLSLEDFAECFKNYKFIVNFDMVKIAYFNGKAAGFFISVPNFGCCAHRAKFPADLLKIKKLKRRPTGYVMLYMGVLPEHRGLGKALAQSITEELKKSGLPGIGALQMDGKVTQHYVEEKISGRYEYSLLSKEVQ